MVVITIFYIVHDCKLREYCLLMSLLYTFFFLPCIVFDFPRINTLPHFFIGFPHSVRKIFSLKPENKQTRQQQQHSSIESTCVAMSIWGAE